MPEIKSENVDVEEFHIGGAYGILKEREQKIKEEEDSFLTNQSQRSGSTFSLMENYSKEDERYRCHSIKSTQSFEPPRKFLTQIGGINT